MKTQMMADSKEFPSSFGRYRILSELGRGAMGVVYKAHDPQIDRLVALKVLRKGRTISERSRNRLLKEAQAIGRLSHPNIVTVFDAGQDHGTVFLAEEFVEGDSLHHYLQRSALEPAAVVSMGLQLAQALAYAHGHGIVHRDIKSYNIICQPDGRVKLTDFGIARIEDTEGADNTRPGQIMGTPAYMAPELLSGAVADARSDLFSLGVVMYEAATGRRPFQGDTLVAVFGAIRESAPPLPHQLNPHVPVQLSTAIMACLAKNPAQRLQDGDELVAALRKCLPETYTGFAGTATPVSTSAPASANVRRRWLLPLCLVALVLALGIGYTLWALVGNQERVSSQGSARAILEIDIRSEPAGAMVFIDGALKGPTPLMLRLSEDTYRLRLEAEGYYHYESALAVDDAVPQSLLIKLKPLIF
jgi:serine/threonine protein kinase